MKDEYCVAGPMELGAMTKAGHTCTPKSMVFSTLPVPLLAGSVQAVSWNNGLLMTVPAPLGCTPLLSLSMPLSSVAAVLLGMGYAAGGVMRT